MPETRTKPSKPQYDIIASRKQVNLFLAGQGSGKTFVAGVLSAKLINQFPKNRGFIGANTYTQLSDSTLFRIRTVWKELWGWTEWSKANPKGCFVVDVQPPSHFNTEGQEFDSYHGKICFKWGTVVFKGSLDNYKAHDGKEFAWAILDETKDTREEAVKEVILGRLREQGMYVDKDGNLIDRSEGNTGFNPLYIFTSPAKVPWINEWFNLDDYNKEILELIYSDETYFYKEIDNKLVVISSAYHNKENLPDNFLENQKKNLPSSLQDLLIYANPFASTGGEFYKGFNRIKNVVDNKIRNGKPELYDPALPLHISFDFNVNPHMTCTVWQIDGKKAMQIDEICLISPRNTTRETCKEFSKRYHDHLSGLFIYGDPAGRHEDTRTEKGQNDYTIIQRELTRFGPSLRVETKAPAVVMRGNFINVLFQSGYEHIEISIGSNCVKSIADYTYGKEDSDGTKLKEKERNKITNVTFEKYHHCSDANDYLLCRAFLSEYVRFQKGGSGQSPKSGKGGSKNSY